MKHLKDLLIAKGKTQTELAAVLMRDKSAITNLLQGKRQLKADEVVKIAAFLEVSEAEILGVGIAQSTYEAPVSVARRPHPNPTLGMQEPQRIPFYGAPTAEAMRSHHITEERGTFYFEDNVSVSDKSYALEVKDNALNLHGFLPGDVVISEMDVPCKAGDVVIVQKYEADAAETLLRIYRPPFLEPMSSDFSFDRLHEERSNLRLISPVIRLVRHFN